MKGEVMAMPSDKKSKSAPDEWQVKNWADTVMEGEGIKKDPKKMKHVKKHMKKMHGAIATVLAVKPVKSTDDLRMRAKQMADDDSEDKADGGADEDKEAT